MSFYLFFLNTVFSIPECLIPMNKDHLCIWYRIQFLLWNLESLFYDHQTLKDSAVGCSYNTNAPCWYMLTQLHSCTKAFSFTPLYANEDCGTRNPCWISQSWSPFPILSPYPGIMVVRHIFARFPSECENPSITSCHCLFREPETPIICVLIDCIYCKSSTQVT